MSQQRKRRLEVCLTSDAPQELLERSVCWALEGIDEVGALGDTDYTVTDLEVEELLEKLGGPMDRLHVELWFDSAMTAAQAEELMHSEQFKLMLAQHSEKLRKRTDAESGFEVLVSVND